MCFCAKDESLSPSLNCLSLASQEARRQGSNLANLRREYVYKAVLQTEMMNVTNCRFRPKSVSIVK
jgi:hypothetical protein